MTAQEWLGNNQLSLDIWNNKYRFNNESFEEWLDRVSGNNSEIKRLIREKKFLFGGRILANRGLNKLGRKITLSNCFLAGTKVLTKEGYKNIEEVNEGDFVLTHDNTWQPVNVIMSRVYKGPIYKIKSKNLLAPIFCTPNHKFLTSDNNWKPISDFIIKSNGHTKIDRLMSSSKMLYYQWSDIDIDILDDFICETKRKIVEEDNNVGISEYVEDRGTYIWRKPRRFINRYFILDEEMLYLIGRWVGDGSVTTRTHKNNPSIWQLVFNATSERKVCEVCYNIINKHFPLLHPTIRETEQNVLALRVENEIFATWFNNNFGKGCEGKYIPEWVGYPRNLLLGLLDSDGSVHSQGNFKLLLKNSKLIDWARKALFHLGINTSEIKAETRQVADSFTIIVNQSRKLIPYLNKTYEDSRMDVNLELDTQTIKIDDIEILEDYDTIVYNLSVENNHSYMVNGVFAHNCYVLESPEDNLESIFDTASKLARTFSYGGGCGIDVSKLRPKDAKVNNAANTTSGTTSFMDFFSYVTGLIGQEGRRKIMIIFNIENK